MKFFVLGAIVMFALMGAKAMAQDVFWHEETRNYRCAGAQSYVICHSTPKRNVSTYRVMIDGKRMWVSYGATLIYGCWVRQTPLGCREIP